MKNIIIVGGGTSGWMTAAMLSHALPEYINIRLVESEDIGTIGVGEATIPHIGKFNAMLGIDEAQFMREVQATFKLGIEFVDWGALGERYMHPFGAFGMPLNDLPFHNYWLRARKTQGDLSLEAFSLNTAAARSGKFMKPNQDPTSLASKIAYAYHLDAGLYAKFLRRFAEAKGLERIEAKVVSTELDPASGFIQNIVLDSGEKLAADLFIDCSGFRGVLIEEALHSGYEDWSDILPMDSAIAVPSALESEPLPYTVSHAREAGWTWQIPLQHRMGNGHVFSSKYMDEQQARDILLQNIHGELLAEPRLLRFKVGRRKKTWVNNCVAIGLSSGFIEPLESTAIHLVQEGITRLVAFLSDLEFSPESRDEYNRTMALNYERIRDFILLHYHVTRRDDSEFWRDVRAVKLPDVLERRLRLMKQAGVHADYEFDIFGIENWLAVAIGQGIVPQSYNPVANTMPSKEFDYHISQFQHAVREIARQMPSHQAFIDHYCKA
ncbi:tryptophan halogenase family protein [Agaribacterium haliotis]|uniref:tryptophan halogenase family protein n=1 Tax=Agaribacterium haliotis TaxID=2013869 RepID=UPI001957B998|nr:tryptophan halogenase family protein [Agaribacterium haliotis]